MSSRAKSSRQSVSLSLPVARRVRALASARRTSQSRVIVDLIETGLQAKELQRRRYLELLDRLRRTKNPTEQERITEELARLTFGE